MSSMMARIRPRPLSLPVTVCFCQTIYHVIKARLVQFPISIFFIPSIPEHEKYLTIDRPSLLARDGFGNSMSSLVISAELTISGFAILIFAVFMVVVLMGRIPVIVRMIFVVVVLAFIIVLHGVRICGGWCKRDELMAGGIDEERMTGRQFLSLDDGAHGRMGAVLALTPNGKPLVQKGQRICSEGAARGFIHDLPASILTADRVLVESEPFHLRNWWVTLVHAEVYLELGVVVIRKVQGSRKDGELCCEWPWRLPIGRQCWDGVKVPVLEHKHLLCHRGRIGEEMYARVGPTGTEKRDDDFRFLGDHHYRRLADHAPEKPLNRALCMSVLLLA